MHNIASTLGRLSTVLERHGERGLPIDPDLVVDLARMLATLAVLAGNEQPAATGPNVIHVDFINRPPNGGNAA